MMSLQNRLASGLFLSLLLVFLLLWIIVSDNIQELAEQYIAGRLEHDIEILLVAVSFDKDNLQLDDKYINPVYKRPYSGHYFLIQNKTNSVRSRSLWDQTLSVPGQLKNSHHITHQTGPQQQSLLVRSGLFVKQGRHLVISVAEDLTPVSKAIEHFKNKFLLFSIVILGGLLLLQVVVLKTGLLPLKTIRRELAEMEQGDIKQLSSDVPDELQAFVHEINQLSRTMNKRLKRSRDSLSDLSHAIKKPLTVLQQFADQQTALQEKSKELLQDQIQRIHNVTDHILKRARVAGKSKTNKRFGINQDIKILLKTMAAMYPQKNIMVEIDMPDNLQVDIDREDMLELTGNLLDNAWKWARSKVIISAKQEQFLSLTIEDDGSAVNVESVSERLNRGVRLDESVSGYGFGLAISSDIVQDYEGSIKFSRSETLGGFRVVITLPVRQQA
ncbi:MAG: sensor histidine kinase [Gammaproteobacteria bacterium]|nr:sensor histidine kinase [Gammaproteobacteria bacterium]